MADGNYDNTDRGAMFVPRDERLILQGKINNNGRDHYAVAIRRQLQDGTVVRSVYVQVATLYENDKKGNEKAPEYSGPAPGFGQDRRLAAWKKEKDGQPYLSLAVSDKQSGGNGGGNGGGYDDQGYSGTPDLDDDIPF